MKYLVLLYGDEQAEAQLSQDDWQALLEKHNEFSMKYGTAIGGGEALKPSSQAQTLRRSGSEAVVTDGPYAETKEQLGGYYVIEAQSMDEVLAMVRELPLASDGAIEVRPVMEM